MRTSEEKAAHLVVLGPYRRRILREIFIGTTAERTIRTSRRPVLMANGVPAGGYRRLLIALDLSESCGAAVKAVADLGLGRGATRGVLHAFDAPAKPLMIRALLAAEEIESCVGGLKLEAERAVVTVLQGYGLPTLRPLVVENPGSMAQAILAAAAERSVDPPVVGTRGRGGVGKLLLGSVAEEVLRRPECDVLTVPLQAG